MAKDWDIQIQGRRVVNVEQRLLRLCAAPRLAPWWVITLDNGVELYARPMEITTARDENDQFDFQTAANRRQSDKKDARNRAAELATPRAQ